MEKIEKILSSQCGLISGNAGNLEQWEFVSAQIAINAWDSLKLFDKTWKIYNKKPKKLLIFIKSNSDAPSFSKTMK